MGFLYGAAIGAIKGSFLSIKFFKISLTLCSSSDMATRYLFQPINGFDSTTSIEVPWNEGLSKDSIENIPKISITAENVWDSSGNRIACSICLEDFLPGETVHSLPQCHHMFHTSCLQQWLIGHKSCPLCRRNL